MAELKNCMLHDELLYHVDFNVWIHKNDDGTINLGMTDIAQSMAGNIIHCRPKKVGKSVKAGKSVATILLSDPEPLITILTLLTLYPPK